MQIRLSREPISVQCALDAARLSLCLDRATFAAYGLQIVSTLEAGGTFLLAGRWEAGEDPMGDPSTAVRQALAARRSTFYLLNYHELEEAHACELDAQLQAGLAEALFLRLAGSALPSGPEEAEWISAGDEGLGGAAQPLALLKAELELYLQYIPVPPSWLSLQPEPTAQQVTIFKPRLHIRQDEASTPLTDSSLAGASAPPTQMLAKHRVAQHLIFHAAYASTQTLHGGQEGLFRVKLTENRRLTPLDYDRNIFHLEMDITGTGLTYEIGDALGVYGRNDPAAVVDFLQALALDPETFVAFELESRGGLQGATPRQEVISLKQLFEQRLDIFGKPQKKFYEALSRHASDLYQQRRLEWLGSEDKEGFTLRQLETVTYADILLEFPSARPPLADLVQMIPAIKPRHYSIASSMRLNPNSVHLLIVEVAWETPAGRQRYGQCTRYLSQLNPQEEDIYLTVDIKPSAMRLPADPSVPIIMAGLGTGMAPFRAFVQERAWQKAQGMNVGPVSLYFGARYRASEYLYGEELDKYAEEGLITRLGLAFSRDTSQKVYIQHKLTEDASMLREQLVEQGGYFYLCGPTWPVPDVRKAIADGIVAGGTSVADADLLLEEMKEAGRYVLEVY
jgi:sulfite reductase (NADPH) flavoprotein alpha-component